MFELNFNSRKPINLNLAFMPKKCLFRLIRHDYELKCRSEKREKKVYLFLDRKLEKQAQDSVRF